MVARAARKRISAVDRRQTILVAARKLFAHNGYESTRTFQIAAAAGTSEALLYRHFASKEALYRAVLRKMIRDQDYIYDVFGMPDATTESLVKVIRAYLRQCITPTDEAVLESVRIMLASLSGDGGYAGVVYRRAMRLQLAPVTRALHAARAAGDMAGPALLPEHVSMLIEHVGTMVAAARALPGALSPYQQSPDRLLHDATWFCCRGLGMTNAAIERCVAHDTQASAKDFGHSPAQMQTVELPCLPLIESQ